MTGHFRACLLAACCMGLLTQTGWAAQSHGKSDQKLLEAVQQSNDADVATLLAHRASPNVSDDQGISLLSWAVIRNEPDILKRLLAAHADPNAVDGNGQGPLALAIENGYPAMVQELLKAGANPNAARANGETPLMLAVRAQMVDVAGMLVARGADVNAREPQFGQTPLMMAAASPRIVENLLAHGADFRATTKTWDVSRVMYTPQTATLGVTGIPWNNAGEHVSKSGGYDALLFAAQAGDLDAVKALVAAGADVNRRSANGATPLLVALYNWKLPESKVPGTRVTNGIYVPGLTYAPNLEIADYLLDHHADAKLANSDGYTPLHAVVIALYKTLSTAEPGTNYIRQVPDPEAKPVDREERAKSHIGPPKPFHEEAILALVKRLLEQGADPNGATLYPTGGPVGDVRVNPLPPGSTAYHAAAMVESPAVAELLAAHGADANRLRQDGQTPFSLAAKNDNLPVLKVMAAHGADFAKIYDPTDKIADAVLSKAEERHHETVLHIAGAAGANDVIDFLVKGGTPLDVKNDHGQTAIDIADEQERFRLGRLLEAAAGRTGPKPVRSTTTTDAFRAAMGLKKQVAVN